MDVTLWGSTKDQRSYSLIFATYRKSTVQQSFDFRFAKNKRWCSVLARLGVTIGRRASADAITISLQRPLISHVKSGHSGVMQCADRIKMRMPILHILLVGWSVPNFSSSSSLFKSQGPSQRSGTLAMSCSLYFHDVWLTVVTIFSQSLVDDYLCKFQSPILTLSLKPSDRPIHEHLSQKALIPV